MRKRLLVAVIAALALVFGAAAAQGAPLNTTNISNDGPADNGDNEVDIGINPTNSQNMISAWNDYGPGGSCGIGWTKNGGRTWHTDWLHGVTPDGGNPTYDYGAGAPSVGFLTDGTAILACNPWWSRRCGPARRRSRTPSRFATSCLRR